MIYKTPKKPENTGTYNRTAAQRKREDWGDKSDLERGYARSKMNSGPIIYPEGSDKI